MHRAELTIWGAHTNVRRKPFSHICVARIFSAGASLGVHFSSPKKLTTFFSRRYNEAYVQTSKQPVKNLAVSLPWYNRHNG